MTKKIRFLVLFALLGIGLPFSVVFANSGLVEMRRNVIGGGGGTTGGGNVQLQASLGQPVAGTSNGGNAAIHSGFWSQWLNTNPTAVDDAVAGFETDEDSAFTTGRVTGNDRDPDGDSLSVTGFDANGTLGAVSDNGDGTFDYDPDGQFDSLALGETANDVFTYTVSDAYGGSDSAAVTITIGGVNDAPAAVDDSGSGYSTDANTPFTINNVLSNDSDPEGDFISVQSFDTAGMLGSLSYNGGGTFHYDPNGQFGDLLRGQSARDIFRYTVSDGALTANATVTITIWSENSTPTAIDDGGAGFLTDHDTAFTTASVLINDHDADGDPLSIESFDASSALGLVSDNGDGTFHYDPHGQFDYLAPDESATDSFTYTLSDGHGGSAIATVTIIVQRYAFYIHLPLILKGHFPWRHFPW
jgi:VCBS repeat-containing protein